MTTYDAECEGCEQSLNIDIDGYIGKFEGVWCEECGYDGENIPYEPVEEKPLRSWDEIKEIVKKMPASPEKSALQMLITHKDGNEDYLEPANHILGRYLE